MKLSFKVVRDLLTIWLEASNMSNRRPVWEASQSQNPVHHTIRPHHIVLLHLLSWCCHPYQQLPTVSGRYILHIYRVLINEISEVNCPHTFPFTAPDKKLGDWTEIVRRTCWGSSKRPSHWPEILRVIPDWTGEFSMFDYRCITQYALLLAKNCRNESMSIYSMNTW